ncbi:MAG: GDP-mannose 4,6-dehydratase [candidate division WOR-3 bacterium]|nr:GDP-mannose 4,6-dehydratase [candidate division WOR-3 bacterium]
MSHSPDKILITGASGFVGRLLARAEMERGNAVIGIHDPQESPDLPFESKGIDIRDKKTLQDFITPLKPQRVYHLAAISSVRVCEENPGMCFEVNVTGTLNLLDVLSKLDEKPRVLFASSCEVYGNVDPSRQPVNEDTRPAPINVYGLSKLLGEEICHYYNYIWGPHVNEKRSHGVLISRGFNHTGPGQRDSFVFPHVARSLVKIEKGAAEPVLRMGNLSVRRDVLDARDAVRAYMMAADKANPGSTCNVTSGRCISIEEGVRMLVEISGLRVKIVQESSRMRSYDIARLTGDASRIGKDLGWRAEISLEQTMKDLLSYWRAKEGE